MSALQTDICMKPMNEFVSLRGGPRRVLAAAHAAHAKQLVRRMRQSPRLPTAAWMNPPPTSKDAH